MKRTVVLVTLVATLFAACGDDGSDDTETEPVSISDAIELEGGVAVTGTGNILVAGSGSDAEGLRLQISGPTLGSRGNVAFTRGVASQLDKLMQNLLDVEGALNDRIDSLQDRLDDVEDRRARLELRWEAVRARYADQFNALDSLLGQLQNTSAFLEQQLSGLIQPNTGNNQRS